VVGLDPLAPVMPATADLPGIGGTIKQRPEDFEVEEIPAYEPSGHGDHLYLWIEKRGLGADYFARRIAERLRIPRQTIGMAGLKDRHAVTRQWVSAPADVADRVSQLEADDLRVLRVSRHTNKLKPGHLHGNRFRILVRGVQPESGSLLERLIGRLRELGLPNYYGPQRFGRDGETAALGLAVLRGEDPARVSRHNPFLRKLALSAAQSVLYNQYLVGRLRDRLFRRVMEGDVMGKWPTGGMFRAEDVSVEQARFDQRHTVHMGPIFGRKTFPASGAAAVRESALLAEAGMNPETFRGFGKLLAGTRRQNVVYVDDLTAAFDSEGARIAFSLPAGSYATILLNELLKNASRSNHIGGVEE
jgi:tRNA pseudouridine13 synthase